MYLARKALSYFYPESKAPATVLEDRVFEHTLTLQKDPGWGTWVAVNDEHTRFIYIVDVGFAMLDLTNPCFFSATLVTGAQFDPRCILKTADNEVICFIQELQCLMRYQLRPDAKKNGFDLVIKRACYMHPTSSSHVSTFVVLADDRYVEPKIFQYDANTLIFLGQRRLNMCDLDVCFVDIPTMTIKRTIQVKTKEFIFDFNFKAPDELYVLTEKNLLLFKLDKEKNYSLQAKYALPCRYANQVWISPVNGDFIIASKHPGQNYRFINCKVVEGKLITLFEKNGPSHHTDQCCVLPCGQFVYYDSTAKEGKSVCLVSGRETSYPCAPDDDLFVTKAEGRYRVGVLSMAQKKKHLKLFALGNYDMKQDVSYPVMKEALSCLPFAEGIRDLIFEYTHDVRFFSKINPALVFNESIEADIFKELKKRILKAGQALERLTPENADYERITKIKKMLIVFYAIIIKNPTLQYKQCREMLEKHSSFAASDFSLEKAPDDMRSTLEFIRRVAATVRTIKQESKVVAAVTRRSA